MTIDVNNVGVYAPDKTKVALATHATGHRDDKKLACRLTLQPASDGQYPQHNHHYTLKFRDAGANPVLEWNVRCSYVPRLKETEPFEFEKI